MPSGAEEQILRGGGAGTDEAGRAEHPGDGEGNLGYGGQSPGELPPRQADHRRGPWHGSRALRHSQALLLGPRSGYA